MDATTIRAAREAKARRMASSGDPKQKVDASGWTPPEMMNTGAKTGLRPVSPRAYKAGGAVKGDDAMRHAGRAPRAFADARVNRNVKDANAEEFGKPHVGALKRGGKAGGSDAAFEGTAKDVREDKELAKKHGMSMKSWEDSAMDEKHDRQRSEKGLASGGRTSRSPSKDDLLDRIAQHRLTPNMRRMEKAGTAPRTLLDPDMERSVQDRMKGITSRTAQGMKDIGAMGTRGASVDQKVTFPLPDNIVARKSGGNAGNYEGGTRPTGGRIARASGGHAKNCGCKACSGGRVGRATGGRTKGKTNIVIAINPAAAQPAAPGMIPPPGDVLPPMKPMGTMPAPGPGPTGGMPMGGAPMPAGAVPRATGGVVGPGHKSYRTYKDMDAGSLSGMGRLEKTEIAKHQRTS